MMIYEKSWRDADNNRESTTIWASFKDNKYHLSGQDMGPSVARFSGKDEYEYALSLTETDMQVLWPFLMRQILNETAPLRFSQVAELCTEAKITPDRWSY